MGCWYETCGLSGLPITPNEKALLFLLVPGSSLDDGRGGFCYPSGLWEPLCPAFPGTYNDDHGTLNFAKKAPAHWKLTKGLIAELNPVWRDDRYDKEWKPLPVVYDYEKFFNPIERGWVQGKSYPRPDRAPDGVIPIGQMLIRRDVWDYLLGTEFNTWYGGTGRKGGHEDAQALVKYVRENPPKENPLSWAFEMEHHFEKTGGNSVLMWSLFRSGESGRSFARYRIAITHGLTDKTMDEDEALAILYEIADIAHVNRMMSHLRRAWQPQTGKGSQDINWGLHENFTRKVAEIAETCRKHDEEDL